MQTTQIGRVVAATRLNAPSEADRSAGAEFEAFFIGHFADVDWENGRRVTGQAGKDARRRTELTSMQQIGAVLSMLGRKKPTALLELLEQLEAWAIARSSIESVCLIDVAQQEAREDSEADAALMYVLGVSRDRISIERATRELAQQLARGKQLMFTLHREGMPSLMDGRVVRTPRAIAAGAR